MRRANTGQIRVIEAFFAVLVVFSSFAVTTNLTVAPGKTKRADLASIGLQALTELDSDGSLGNCIASGNWSALSDALNAVLPTGLSFNMTVYDEQSQQVNTEVITNGGFGGQDVAFVEYACANRGPVFHCYIVRLRLAVAS